VVVRGNPLLAQRADRPDIETGREAQVSVQHAVAAALLRGAAGLDEFTDACVNDPAVASLRRRVEVERDPALSTIAAEVDLTTDDGRRFALSTAAARGSAANPMHDREIEDKLRRIAAAWRPGHDIEPLIAAVWTLEQSDDAARLLALTVPG
jgi:2-methylcitrate dehydratase PrpD